MGGKNLFSGFNQKMHKSEFVLKIENRFEKQVDEVQKSEKQTFEISI